VFLILLFARVLSGFLGLPSNLLVAVAVLSGLKLNTLQLLYSFSLLFAYQFFLLLRHFFRGGELLVEVLFSLFLIISLSAFLRNFPFFGKGSRCCGYEGWVFLYYAF
jgi:hypothetical protein